MRSDTFEKIVYNQWREWFNRQFNGYPEETYHSIRLVDDMVAMRRDFQNILDNIRIINVIPDNDIIISDDEINRWVIPGLKKFKIITFEEYYFNRLISRKPRTYINL